MPDRPPNTPQLTLADYEARKAATLRKYGCPQEELWRTECHSGPDLLNHYDPGVIYDFGLEDAFGVVYRHESGSITQIASFAADDEESFEEACAFVAAALRNPAEWPPNLHPNFFTARQWWQLLQNGRASAESEGGVDHAPVVKLFTPDANATFLLSEVMPHEPDIAFGLCDPGLGFPELGYASLSELASIRGGLGLPIERDLHFRTDKRLSELAEKARRLERIEE